MKIILHKMTAQMGSYVDQTFALYVSFVQKADVFSHTLVTVKVFRFVVCIQYGRLLSM